MDDLQSEVESLKRDRLNLTETSLRSDLEISFRDVLDKMYVDFKAQRLQLQNQGDTHALNVDVVDVADGDYESEVEEEEPDAVPVRNAIMAEAGVQCDDGLERGENDNDGNLDIDESVPESESVWMTRDFRKFMVLVGIIILDLLLILICIFCVRVMTKAKQRLMRARIQRKKTLEIRKLDTILNHEEKKANERSVKMEVKSVENSESFKNRLLFSIIEQEMIVKDIVREVADNNDNTGLELANSPSLPVVRDESFDIHENDHVFP